MKYSNKKLIAVIALIAATLCISAVVGRRMAAQTTMEWLTLKVNQKAPASFNAQVSDGKVVAMVAVYPDGSKVALKKQDKTTCNWTCPSGQSLSCWEDQDGQMSICECGTGESAGAKSSRVVSLGKLGRVE